MDGGGKGTSAVPVYQHFVEIAKKLNPSHISMIIPAKWYTGGKGLLDFRDTMLNDKRIAFIADFEDSRFLFPTADIAGGVCYFNWVENYQGQCTFVSHKSGDITISQRSLSDNDVFIRDMYAYQIIRKVKTLNEKTMDTVVFSRNPFGFSSNSNFSKYSCDDSLRIFTSKGWAFVKRDDVRTNQKEIRKWKVIMSKASAEHAGQSDRKGMKKIISRLAVIEPNEICTESYLLLSCFEKKEEASNLRFYMKTRFVRFLLSAILLTQNIAKDKFKLIPVQDFSRLWTDKQLYAKYYLSQEEISYIESYIKPME